MQLQSAVLVHVVLTAMFCQRSQCLICQQGPGGQTPSVSSLLSSISAGASAELHRRREAQSLPSPIQGLCNLHDQQPQRRMTLGEDLCSEVMGSVSRDNPSACINVNLKGYEGRFFKNAVTAKRWIDGAVHKGLVPKNEISYISR